MEWEIRIVRLKKLLCLTLHRLYSNSEILLLVRKPQESVKKEKDFPGVFCIVSEDNIKDCLNFEDASFMAAYRNMLLKGDIGHYGYLNGKCVFRSWLQCSGDIKFEGCTVYRLKENEYNSHFTFCAPEARGNGFQCESISQWIHMYPDGIFYSMVLPEKEISLNNYKRNGFKVCQLIRVENRLFQRRLKRKYL